MPINDHWISGLTRKPLKHVGKSQNPALLVIHYSVTDTVAQAVSALNAAGLGYHILIEKDGKAFQTRPLNQTAAHPGLSNWKAAGGVTLGNSVQVGSIGICLMNKGYDFKKSPHTAGKLIYNPDDASMQEWESYPKAQVDSCASIVKEIVAAYPIAEIVGHHDIAIMGKFDPGPLFNLEALNALIAKPKPLGLATTAKRQTVLRRTADAAGKSVATLAKDAPLHIRAIAYGPKKACIDSAAASRKRYLTRWASVDINGSNKHAGFVDMKDLARTPLDPPLAAKL
jgi:N-acetylmuramoyl-L-alanine amidase